MEFTELRSTRGVPTSGCCRSSGLSSGNNLLSCVVCSPRTAHVQCPRFMLRLIPRTATATSVVSASLRIRSTEQEKRDNPPPCMLCMHACRGGGSLSSCSVTRVLRLCSRNIRAFHFISVVIVGMSRNIRLPHTKATWSIPRCGGHVLVASCPHTAMAP